MKTILPAVRKSEVIDAYKNFIISKNHPCVIAQTVFKMDQFTIECIDDFGTATAAQKILEHIKKYIDQYDFESNTFETFIATFPHEDSLTELEFEKKLWEQLSQIHQLDTEPWDEQVESNPKSHEFSFSIHGTAFYIVGMHPNSSRKARQAPYPTLVFNLHHQFENLREMGAYEKVRDRIRKRDKKLQGFINPVLSDFGDASEAMQYSGRAVGENWKCPFHHAS